ncbi:MAG: ATP-binding domain-containing protein, partial [Pirellulales bacterium]|nr:ATP-binding domain-containing protein [Pirellulales bacterium]
HPEDGSLEAFLEQVALVADTDAFEDSTDRVTLMTLHAAKGLEFPHVFVIGVEDDLIPHKRSKDTDAQYEEERRLLFVGITRAQQWLQLSCCKRRAIRGDVRPVIPSPFFNELPLDEMRRVETTVQRDWFDEDFVDQEYPESWDLPEEGDSFSSGTSQVRERGEFVTHDDSPSPPHHPPSSAVAQQAKPDFATSLKTAADMIAGGTTPLSAYRQGVQVRHAKYGEGTIVSVTGRGPKRTAKVQFADGQHDFRLAFADLEVL